MTITQGIPPIYSLNMTLISHISCYSTCLHASRLLGEWISSPFNIHILCIHYGYMVQFKFVLRALQARSNPRQSYCCSDVSTAPPIYLSNSPAREPSLHGLLAILPQPLLPNLPFFWRRRRRYRVLRTSHQHRTVHVPRIRRQSHGYDYSKLSERAFGRLVWEYGEDDAVL